jgi:hypothetical protein
MRLIPDDVRFEIEIQRPIQIRICPTGFDLDGELMPKLAGRIHEARLIRKLFRDKQLQCRSTDGIQGADGDKECADCEWRSAPCQASLRISIILSDGRHGSLDLATTSARNLMRLDEELSSCDIPIAARTTLMTIVAHERWQEVAFVAAELEG